MSIVVHRTSLELVLSAHTPDYPEPAWKHSPDLSAVADVPTRYWAAPADWDAEGAGPVEMSQSAKGAVDAAEQTAARETAASRIDDLEDVLRAALLTILDELNDQHTTTVNAMLDAADDAVSLADYKARMIAISDLPVRTVQQFRTSIRNKLGT